MTLVRAQERNHFFFGVLCFVLCVCVFFSAGCFKVKVAAKFANKFWAASSGESFGKVDTDGFRASLREVSILRRQRRERAWGGGVRAQDIYGCVCVWFLVAGGGKASNLPREPAPTASRHPHRHVPSNTACHAVAFLWTTNQYHITSHHMTPTVPSPSFVLACLSVCLHCVTSPISRSSWDQDGVTTDVRRTRRGQGRRA